jgi:hypothetical protein
MTSIRRDVHLTPIPSPAPSGDVRWNGCRDGAVNDSTSAFDLSRRYEPVEPRRCTVATHGGETMKRRGPRLQLMARLLHAAIFIYYSVCRAAPLTLGRSVH